MEISYKREIKHNYLVIAPDPETGAGYEANMMSANEIRGLMPMHIRYQDGRPYYYYDITSRQPLNRLLETRFISRDEISRIMIQIHVVLEEMDGYLLSGEGILLNPELIYVEPELFQVGLCLVPGQKGDFGERLSRFLQYILKHVNHKDRECVVLAYGMYQESLKDHCGIDDILRFISPSNGRNAGMDQWAEGQNGPMDGVALKQNGPMDGMALDVWDGDGGNGNQDEWGGTERNGKRAGWSGVGKRAGWSEAGNQAGWSGVERKGVGNQAGWSEAERYGDGNQAQWGGINENEKQNGWNGFWGSSVQNGRGVLTGEDEHTGWSGTKRDEGGTPWDGSIWGKASWVHLIMKQAGAWLAVVALLPAALWLFGGVDKLHKYFWPLICLDGGLLLVIAIMDVVRLLFGEKNIGTEAGNIERTDKEGRWDKRDKRGRADNKLEKANNPKKADNLQGADKSGRENFAEDSPWRILFEDEEEPASEPMGSSSCQIPQPKIHETFQTTLLTGQNQREETRFLKPIEDTGEEIPILYYPFVIGQNKNLVDYVLQRDGVSRFHLRIDEKEGQYSVTDLNSTNGTRINGRLLDANETARIETGDEILIADAGYIFS